MTILLYKFPASLSIVTIDGQQYLQSYQTIVGKFMLGTGWVLTRHRYSKTTTRHLGQFAEYYDVTWQDAPFKVQS